MSTLLQQLEQLASLAAAATPGEWVVITKGNTVQSQAIESLAGKVCSGMSPKKANAAYIAAARNLLTPENLALLVTALAAPAAGVQWIEVSERLPEVDTTSPLAMSRNVLVAISEHEQAVAYYDYRTGHNEWVALRGNIGGKVTHWMNLPGAPADAPR